MGRFFRRFNSQLTSRIGNAFSKLVGAFLGFDQGSFVVKHGKHEITVPLRICTNRVWVAMDTNRIDGCAQNPVDYVGYRLLRNKVIFFIDVQSEQCKISWFANEDHGDRQRWDRWDREFKRKEDDRKKKEAEKNKKKDDKKEDKKDKKDDKKDKKDRR